MSSEYYSTSHDFLNDIADLEHTTFWPAASWATEPLDLQGPPIYDSCMPRSMQKDLAEFDLALANDGAFGPSATQPLDGTIPMFNFDYHISPVPMIRTTSDTSGYRTTQPRHIHHDTSNRKRAFQQIDMSLSQSYSHSQAPWPSNGSIAFKQQPRIDEVQVYEPGDYCSKLASESGAVPIPSKKQRVSGFVESQPLAWSSSYAPNMCVPWARNVAPSANMSTSMSTTHLSPSSLTSSEAMSRQSSVSNASVTDAFDMMRIESSFSTTSDLFPLDQIDGSFVSCVTEKPTSRQSTSGLHDGSHSLSGVGFVGANPFSFYGHDSSAANVSGRQNLQQAGETHFAYGESASNNASVEAKASERRRKHIDNSRQSIAPRRSSDITATRSVKSRLSAGGPRLQHGPTTVTTSRSTTTKPPLNTKEPAQVKEAISKAPYVRPHHPKLYCNMCEDSNGFRGEHELRRHWDREHASRRKVWICLQPSTRTDWWPAKPLTSCKQCMQQKQYNVYYNAAAHLRRAHFCPRKRGRKAKGEEREIRAGKAGGDWPPIDWLKANGWLKEIEVDSTQTLTPMESSVDSVQAENCNEVPFTQPAFFVEKQDPFATGRLPTDDLSFTQPTMEYNPGYSLPMQETVSAPACFPPTAAMSLYVANGYAF